MIKKWEVSALSKESEDNKKPRILFLSVSKSIGGVESYIDGLVAGNLFEPFSITATGLWPGVLPIKALGPVSFTSNRFFLDIIKIARVVRKVDPHVIHCNDILTYFAGIFLNILSGKKKIVVSIHSVLSEHNIFSPWLQKILIMTFSTLINMLKSPVIVFSEHQLNDLLKHGIYSSRIHLIEHSVSAQIDYSKQININLVSFVGRLSYEKGPDIFLKIAKSLNDRFKCDFYGEGVMMASLKNILPKAIFHGFIRDKSYIYSNAGIVLITSRTESFCFVLIECILRGHPVLSLNLPAVVGILREFPKLSKIILAYNPTVLTEKVENFNLFEWKEALSAEYVKFAERFSPLEELKKTMIVYGIENKNKEVK